MTEKLINFKDYPQYTLQEWKDGTFFNLSKKKFYQSKKSFIKEMIEDEQAHFKILTPMIMLHIMSLNYFGEGHLSDYIFEKNRKVEYLWSSYFYYLKYKDSKPLLFALCDENFIDEILVENEHLLKLNEKYNIFYKQENVLEYMQKCKYKNKNENDIGKVIQSLQKKDILLNDFKSMLNPLVNNGVDFITKTLNPILNYKKTAQDLKKNSQSILEKYNELTEEEKIAFAEIVLKKNKWYDNVEKLISSVKIIYLINQKYQINDLSIKHDYERLINKDLPELLNFMDIYRHKKIDSIQIQVNELNSFVEKIEEEFNEDINTLIKVKNRVLKEKVKK